MNTEPAHAAFARALLDPAAACPAGLRAWNGSATERRFAVHRNNVLGSLVAALADAFPVTRELVGPEFFGAMAALFVRADPPRSPLLAHYGARFPDSIAAYAPAAGVPYLADVARLEWARVEACHAADAPPWSGADAALVQPAQVGELRPRLHPATRAVASPHAIVSLWAAHQGPADWDGLDVARPEAALVTRPAFEVRVVRCDAGTAAFVAAAGGGASFADCAQAGLAAGAGFDLAATVSLLIAHGALSALALPEENFA